MLKEMYFSVGLIIAVVVVSRLSKSMNPRDLLEQVAGFLLITVLWPLFIFMALVF